MGLPTETGATRFARYAFPPNELGYCGPDDASVLLQHATDGGGDRRGRRPCPPVRGCVGLPVGLSDASGLEPLDPLVVEAYWVGNDLLGKVDPRGAAGRRSAAASGPRPAGC